MAIIAQKIGRKWGYITACVCIMLGWIISYRATSVAELLISETFHGLGTNSLLPVCYIGMTEMLAPKYRHITMQTYGIAQGVGMAACGILGRYFHYKTVSLIMLMPVVAAIALALMWLESPFWLANRGEFDKCEQTFFKLRGLDDVSRNELLELVTAHKEQLPCAQEQITIRSFWKKISRRDFYTPSIHTFILFLAMHWGGIDAIYVYFIEIVKKTSSNDSSSVFYGSIIMYSVVLTGLCITNFTILKFNNKPVLLYSAGSAALCLVVSSIISALQTTGALSDSSPLLMYSLIAYTTCAHLGFHSIVYIIAVELMPVKHRSLGGALLIIYNCTLYASALKLSPYIAQSLGLWCTFFIYALNMTGCLWFISKFVPETKARSLQEIEKFYMSGNFEQRHIEVEDLSNLRLNNRAEG